MSELILTPIVTPVLVGNTIAALGTPSDGQQGKLRIGATPYEFVRLLWDATYGHWVSDPFAGHSVSEGIGPGDIGDVRFPYQRQSFSTGDGAAFSAIEVPSFDDAVAAGLTLQFRAAGWTIAETGHASPHGYEVWVSSYHVSPGDTGTTLLSLNSWQSGELDGTFNAFDSGWQSLAAPGSPKKIAQLGLGLTTQSAASGDTFKWSGSLRCRWIG